MKENKTREESKILKEIRRNTTRENEVVQALKRNDSLTWEEDRVVYMEGRVYVPNNKKIKEEILKESHDLVYVGYPGQHRMLELLKKNYWWPGLKGGCQKICTGLFQVLTEQSSTPKEGQRTIPIGNTPRTVAGNQHRHHQTFTKVKRNGCYSRHC